MSTKKWDGVVVVCTEGPHGVGKSFNTETIAGKSLDYVECMDEGFVPKVKTKFHPQSLFEETKWALAWFENITKRCYFNRETGKFEHNKIILTDRSPYSSCVYSQKCRNSLKIIIDGIRKEFEKKGVKLYIICLRADEELTYTRIQNRLKLNEEKWRLQLDENSRKWLKIVIERYELLWECWNAIVDSTDGKKCCKKILEFVEKVKK
jgi:hypothetical protein